MGETSMGRRIRYRREQLGIGLRELARRIEIEAPHLSRIELGKQKEIRTDTLRKLAFHLGVTTDWIVGSYDPPLEESTDTELKAAGASV